MRNRELYEALKRFDIDAPNARGGFAARLAREQGWTTRFTGRAIEEYRRFLYLAVTGDRPATPSKAVDAVWHLHLIYTRSYWDRLCGELLKRPLHHEPSAGGATEDDRHAEQYRATLRNYAEEFGHAAPDDIWPTGEDRPREKKLAPKSRKAFFRFAWPLLLAAGLMLAAAGADDGAMKESIFDHVTLSDFFMGFAVFYAAGFVAVCVYGLLDFFLHPMFAPFFMPAINEAGWGWFNPLPVVVGLLIIALFRAKWRRGGRGGCSATGCGSGCDSGGWSIGSVFGGGGESGDSGGGGGGGDSGDGGGDGGGGCCGGGCGGD